MFLVLNQTFTSDIIVSVQPFKTIDNGMFNLGSTHVQKHSASSTFYKLFFLFYFIINLCFFPSLSGLFFENTKEL